MLRAVSKLSIEGTAFDLFSVARRDIVKAFRSNVHTSTACQTVLYQQAAAPPPADGAPPPPPRPPVTSQKSHTRFYAAAVALTATVGGGLYLYNQRDKEKSHKVEKIIKDEAVLEPPIPPDASHFPAHIPYLIIGGGTSAFACARAIRAAHPTAAILMVNEERALPYMRPPLSKELWAEPDLEDMQPDKATFRQWNGRRRPMTYEPESFYTPVSEVTGEWGGVAAARGWTVTSLDVDERRVGLRGGGEGDVCHVTYDKCLLATGVVPRRLPALSAARAVDRAVTVRQLRDVIRLARGLRGARGVLLVGGGPLAAELAAALTDRVGDSTTVTLLCREEAPLAKTLPLYLAKDVARRLEDRGVIIRTQEEVVDSEVKDNVVHVKLASGEIIKADMVVECVGATPDTSLAAAAGLEIDEARGGVRVNGHMAAVDGLYVAGDVASFHDPLLGRRRIEHHDHAVVSGRLAGDNMAGVSRRYKHQSMYWSDLGPTLGYEAIGIIDSSLKTVGIFSEEAVSAVEKSSQYAETAAIGGKTAAVGGKTAAVGGRTASIGGETGTNELITGANEPGLIEVQNETAIETVHTESNEAESKSYSHGVVLYLRDDTVVGILLYNLFNRMHTARQVLSVGKFEDLLEVGKLFSPHTEHIEEE